MKLSDGCYFFSKKIAQLNTSDENPPHAKQLKLQRSVRLYASAFLQENMQGLMMLPTEEHLKQLQAKRKLEVQRQIAAEKQAALEAQQRALEEQKRKETRVEYKVEYKKSEQSPTTETGWAPPSAATSGFDIDPMLQQMNIIRDYIKKAKQARKWDEMHMLEANLKELETEYKRQQNCSS